MTSAQEGTAKKSRLINGTMIVLAIYNLVYWLAPLVKPFGAFRNAIQTQWGLMSFLEFLAVASLIVDITVRWDQFGQQQRRNRLIITFLLAASFFVRLVFGIMSLYIVGEAH